MCLGVPGRVIEVREFTATVDFWGVRKDVSLMIVDEPVAPGDYILNHVGFAIRRIPPESVEETLALYEMLIDGDDTDLMTSDIRGEIRGAVRGTS
jgi:hydrogenase expression/formation protein HypC